MASVALPVLFQGTAIQLGRALKECQMLEQLALSRVAKKDTTTLQSFDSLMQTIEQFTLLFQRLAVQKDIQNMTMNSEAVDRMTLAVLREALAGENSSSPQNAGDIELF
ncbi:hypothetical protein [Gluconobacter japonicus]|uniref:Uncharacterized protein n=2 Tax=Gluconobacter japonicus TaxID=376620 RepID=A0A9Q2FH34_GLUJA|nr:hypothetical protein [Gluconobacter japonicus]KXV28496.1 hypothetical protein AD936_19460 [Gluconobacter japonicus]KXV29390.1 hypothetical protein AD938_02060 [Gluconobacter japonicus]MBF0869439.1 hypothetical protein [Gluconobacter japonicus]GAP25209.1 hypothetical protein GLF_2091 [Gluconobacter frateurii NBRC 101659]